MTEIITEPRFKIIESPENPNVIKVAYPGPKGDPGLDGEGGGGSGDLVFSAVPDAAVLANSPSIFYPDEALTNEATLTAAGYALIGYADRPTTYSIASDGENNALQVDSSANYSSVVCGVGIPAVANAGVDFDIIFVPEPRRFLLAQVADGPAAGANTGFVCGVADSAADVLYGMNDGQAVNNWSTYYTSTVGVMSTGALGPTGTRAHYAPLVAYRLWRRSGTLHYGGFSSMGGWPGIRRVNAVDPSYDGCFLFGSRTFAGAITHAFFGIYDTNNSVKRARLRAIWRAV